MSSAIEFGLNGNHVRVDDVSPNVTLLEWLRTSGLTGSKEGCAEGDCGACSVAMIDRDARGKRCYRAINSCLVPLPLIAGREIITVEGIASPKRHPVQEAMIGNFGSQCGYCTPGFIMSLFEGYYRRDLKTAAQVDEQLCGNLCRCTGYRPIRDAAADALFGQRKGADAFEKQLAGAKTKLGAMRYIFADERFLRPASLEKLFAVMPRHPDARLIAGATELGLEITKKFRKFPVLISLEAIPELSAIRESQHEWWIGAAATLTRIDEALGAEYPELHEMLVLFGSRQIRNRATMGGNIVTASPIGDSAPVLMALEANVVLASANGERTLPIDDFFVGYRKNALRRGEILKSIVVPRFVRETIARRRFFKASKRREMDISTVAGCFAVRLDSAGSIVHARLAFGGVAAMPARARETEAALIGRGFTCESCEAVLPILEREFTPISDVRAGAAYRRGLIKALLRKFFAEELVAADEKKIARQLRQRDEAMPHESAHKHVTGEALYVDDYAQPAAMLEVWPVCSPHAHAKIVRRDASAAREMRGVRAVLLAEDVPGLNDVGAVRHDEPLFAAAEVFYHSQIIALVVGETQEICRAAAEKVIVEYEPLAPIFTIEEAIAAESFHTEPAYIRRGDVAAALPAAPRTFAGEFSCGGQDHFALESHASWAECGEDGTIFISSSTQHPSEVQHIVAHVLKLPMHSVVVECSRMGGGFGGKETQAAIPAALAALAASKAGEKVRVRFNRDQDMMITGKRHPFLAKFEVGFSDDALIRAAKIDLFSNGGWTLDLSRAITDRALFHLDNAYYIPNVEFSGRVAKTNLASNTAFRGFGGPQGMLMIEEIIDRIARELGLAPEVVRERNLYRGEGETNTTHYGQEIEDNRIQRVWHELLQSSEFVRRREEIRAWNGTQANRKRGLAITPVKFGVSFTTTHLNQAGALVLLYQDGTAQVNHGGTEMGQGVYTNIALITSRELGISPDRVRVMATRTDKVPNTSATAASCGTDLNGAAVKDACDTLRARLLPFATAMLAEKLGRHVTPDNVVFATNRFFDSDAIETQLPIAELYQRAYLARTSLSATGFYRTPDINYDRGTGRGKPFHYYAVGAAVSEVEIDGFTGMHRLRRVDILHDAGSPVNVGVSRGQIEGGFVQGAGWLTCEELVWDSEGRLQTHSPDTYKIPAIGDAPEEFNVALLANAKQPNVVHGSKAVGEPPLMLAISVREAIRDAVAAFRQTAAQVALASPATAEAIFNAINGAASASRLVQTQAEHATAEQVLK